VNVEVRPLTPADDLAAFGRIVLDSYRALDGHPVDSDYDDELRDVATRVATATVLAAFAAATPLGCVTYVEGADNPYAEHLGPDEASFRMLGVAGHAQGRGVGEALVTACIDTARDDGRGALFIHSGDWMAAAHRLYGRLGFVRVRERDWHVDGIVLLGFHLAL
jgi:GNAT superfamily N-acetyltransferase